MRKRAKKQPRQYTRGLIAAVFLATALGLNTIGVWLLATEPFPVVAFVPPPTPEEYLAIECQSEDCDLLLLQTIISCESGWRMVKNATSSAYGYFQIIDGTEKTTPQYAAGLRKFDPYTNIDMGLFLYESRGTNPWNESKHCWLPRYRQAKYQQAATLSAAAEE